MLALLLVTAQHPALTAEEARPRRMAPRHARVIVVTSDVNYGFAIVDGNGDGQEPEAEMWTWHEGTWMAGGPSSAGFLKNLDPV